MTRQLKIPMLHFEAELLANALKATEGVWCEDKELYPDVIRNVILRIDRYVEGKDDG